MSWAVPFRYSLALGLCRLHAIIFMGGMCWLSTATPQNSELFTPAFQETARSGGYQLTLLNAPIVRLSPISAFELVADRTQTITTGYQGQAIASAGALRVRLPMDIPELPAFIRREIPALWRITVPSNQFSDELPLSLEWEHISDNQAVRGAGPDLAPKVHPWAHTRSLDEQGRLVIEGGVFIDIPVQSLHRNHYTGRVHIVLDES
ncbi:MAG: hypothetical protein MI750_10275 [Xanthomonadales bacterium]|nr:hypothetical protein [Xanthomonadales bacterium]